MMKKQIIFNLIAILLLLPVKISAQVSIEIKINSDTNTVHKYKPVYGKQKQIFLYMGYGSYTIHNPKQISKIRGKTVEKVQLIYTAYPETGAQEELNKKRLLSLYLIAPQLFEDKMISWEFIEQTGANAKNVYNYFHGFIITYRNTPVWSSTGDEKEYFENIIQGKAAIRDSTILKVFDRNKWEDMLIVCDMTGSMSPYIAELLLWYSLNIEEQNNSAFVFFNDGDLKDDDEKIIGKTGGIYTTSKNNLDTVINKIVETIQNGGGGDAPENDVEALLYAVKKYPKKENIVLIADNWSAMRDYELMKTLKKPVKIILCGVSEKINTEYLDLAYKTGGTVHTIEEDILNLMKVKEGKVIKIGDDIFRLKNGKFEQVN